MLYNGGGGGGGVVLQQGRMTDNGRMIVRSDLVLLAELELTIVGDISGSWSVPGISHTGGERLCLASEGSDFV